ncbi:putative transmembrane protein [Toxoplasma gondii RUB]|uniref:Putative transmembrane protein n=4 Tax=Toxoplasma gondii TaxID=5811 RepID=A0A086LXB7_TOXGO|nr:putative transmembrane protein [Toxoplasma gondii RUB]KFH00943.1 putative transmembrane protein [Toxoplasma gondii VAND]KFH02973.1 putative transmembrane protein [Toxoplasma gondii MAS]PUA84711.1 putative transmembrane protein [Toxoplasma gondii TgCATBr9]
MTDAKGSHKKAAPGRNAAVLSLSAKSARLRGSSVSSSHSEKGEQEAANHGVDRQDVEDEVEISTSASALEESDGVDRHSSPSRSNAGTLRLPSRDARDRLFSAFLEEDEEEDAEVIIERNGRIRVHPRGHRDSWDYTRHRSRYPLPSYLVPDEEQFRDEREGLAELELLREIRRERLDRDIHRHRTEAENLIEDAVHRILLEEEARHPLHLHRSNRPFAGLQLTEETEGDAYASAAGSSVMSSPVGMVIGFILGFVGILLISSLLCVIRAVYVKKQKEAMKKLLREKLGPEAGFDTDDSPAGAESSDTLAAEPVPGAEDGWVDVRVDQQSAPAEEAMMDVARMDTLQRSATKVVEEAPERAPEEQQPAKKTIKKKKSFTKEERATEPTVTETQEDKPKKNKKKKDDFKRALSAKHRG